MSASSKSPPETYTTPSEVITPVDRRLVPENAVRPQAVTPPVRNVRDLRRQGPAILSASRTLQNQTPGAVANVDGFGSLLPTAPYSFAGLPRRNSAPQASSRGSFLPAVTTMSPDSTAQYAASPSTASGGMLPQRRAQSTGPPSARSADATGPANNASSPLPAVNDLIRRSQTSISRDVLYTARRVSLEQLRHESRVDDYRRRQAAAALRRREQLDARTEHRRQTARSQNQGSTGQRSRPGPGQSRFTEVLD